MKVLYYEFHVFIMFFTCRYMLVGWNVDHVIASCMNWSVFVWNGKDDDEHNNHLLFLLLWKGIGGNLCNHNSFFVKSCLDCFLREILCEFDERLPRTKSSIEVFLKSCVQMHQK